MMKLSLVVIICWLLLRATLLVVVGLCVMSTEMFFWLFFWVFRRFLEGLGRGLRGLEGVLWLGVLTQFYGF